MKNQLLSAAIVLAGTFAFAPTVEAKSSMDSNLTMEWMNTDVAPSVLDTRQGFGLNGKFYLQNKATKKIEIWDQTGKTGEIASGEGTNITFDDAGNIIVRIGTFNTAYVSTRNELRIIPADGSAVVDIPLSGITPGRLDFWGHVKGNVLDETKGGVLYMGTNWHPSLIEIPIIGGKQDVANTYSYAYTSPFAVPGNFATTTFISSWDGGEELTMLSPLNEKTNCNSIQKMGLDADDNWVHKSYYITPRHSSCAGYYIFQVGDKKYIVYPSGATSTDGFSVSKLETKENSAVETTDELVRISSKYSEQKDDGNVMYKPNAFFGNHLTAEVISDTEVSIYQYYPGGYIAKYKLTLPASSVTEVEANKTSVFGGIGEITIEGEVSTIEVYTIGGSIISRNEANVKCAPGLYIVKTDDKATKVIVK